MIAIGLPFPRAVKQPIRSRGGILVKRVITGGFAFVRGTASCVRRWQGVLVVANGHRTSRKLGLDHVLTWKLRIVPSDTPNRKKPEGRV